MSGTATGPAGPKGAPGVPRERAVVVGVDSSILSGRAVVVRVADGAKLVSVVHAYPHAVMERELAVTGEPPPPDWALQVPADYVEVLRTAVPQAVRASGADAAAADPVDADADVGAAAGGQGPVPA